VSLAPTAAGRSVLAQLTEGVPLPFAALPRVLLTRIVSGIVTAWRDIPEEQTRTADEAALNAMMETQLNRLAEQNEELRTLVAAVVRGKETINFNGVSLEKRPDLSIILTNGVRERDFPLPLECKLIDTSARKGIDLYCNNGLKRFVNGDYGWARREAIMLGYVRDGSRIAVELNRYLARKQATAVDPYCTEVLPVPVGSQVDQGQSRHCRQFRYLHRSPNDEPGPIEIRHIWLEAPRLPRLHRKVD
jgi:hypothetical protein